MMATWKPAMVCQVSMKWVVIAVLVIPTVKQYRQDYEIYFIIHLFLIPLVVNGKEEKKLKCPTTPCGQSKTT